jgi:two-component system response regulator FixJ
MAESSSHFKLVHIVDDELSIRRSIDFLLRGAGYHSECWCDGNAFLSGADRTRPACVLLDVRMPGIDGLEVQKRLVEAGQEWPVIVLTGHGDTRLAVRAMKAGALDFLEKPFDREKLLSAVASGFARINRSVTEQERCTAAFRQLDCLTEREREVLDGLACGYPNKTIAFDLGISPRTVEVYRANVMAKLAVTNFADVLRIGFAAGLGSEQHWRETHGSGKSRTADHRTLRKIADDVALTG